MLLAAVTTSSVDRRQSEDRLRLVIDTLPAMVWSKSPDGSADFVNQRFREYTGPVLGVLPNSDYESDKIDLRHGDVLVLYTDGAVEAENQAGEQYSATRLAKIASMYSQQSADELVEKI